MTHIAIIGAGLSGLVLARELSSHANVTVFEKSRGVSGRTSTRYADPYQFDHGAQFFSVKTDAFRAYLEPLKEAGVVARWDARFVELDRNEVISSRQWDEHYPHYVGAPKMNQVAKYLAEGVNVKLHTRVDHMTRHDDHRWVLHTKEGDTLGTFDWVISTAPPAQATELLPDIFAHHHVLQETTMLGCYALMLGFKNPLPLSWDAALVTNADISWVSVNSSKPGRSDDFTLLVNSTNAWAEAHMNDDRDEVKDYLCKEVSDVIGHDVMQAEHRAVHGWRYANIGKQQTSASLIDKDNHLAACGDWCIQGRVEAAFTSAMHLAEQLKHAVA